MLLKSVHVIIWHVYCLYDFGSYTSPIELKLVGLVS